MPGASRLSARAAARIGAGLVTLAMTRTAWPHLAGQLMSAMAHALDDASATHLCADWQALLGSRRWGGLVLGPGAMPGLPPSEERLTKAGPPDASDAWGAAATLRAMALAALAADMPVVLDADALMAFEGDPAPLFKALHARAARTGQVSVVLTPHEGEFSRLFGADEGVDKFSRTARAARRAQAVVLHKGADTVLAAPDGRLMLHDHAPPWLATAGAGDVLAGFVAGLMAQGLDAWHAALAAAWVHGQCAHRFGPGLLADDLPEQVPAVLRQLWGVRSAEA
jgi:NAD(P)H-hydrate epimerase